jgi:hypothetical protein
VILGGHPATGTLAPMPAVGAGMTDQEIADATDYVRSAWSNAAPVIQKTGLVGDIRAKTISGLAGPWREGREQRPLPDRTEFDPGCIERNGQACWPLSRQHFHPCRPRPERRHLRRGPALRSTALR